MERTVKKFIIVTGGVLSGLGKGITVAGIGFFFSDRYKLCPIKLDGYLNTDPGTMNPLEHGEVFVLDDGSEVDMDFGHYERFFGQNAIKSQSITMGKVFQEIRERERRGDFLGKTVQFIPHVTDLIQDKVISIANETKSNIVLIEIGGTIGDLENELFVESMRQLKERVGKDNICYIHLTYVPIPYGVKEQKTKPTQQSVSSLHKKGIRPDFIVARSSEHLTKISKNKIALFANLKPNDVFSAPDLTSIYQIPKIFDEQNLIENICEKLVIEVPSKEKLSKWEELLKRKKERTVTITIAGKYMDLEDSYASVVESLRHCECNLRVNINIEWIDTSKDIDYDLLKRSDGVIVPGGFGSRGTKGKLKVIKFIREEKIPFLGICYGLQLAVVEFARNICGIKDANSYEIDKNTINPIITLLDEQKQVVKLGGTMRLGAYNSSLKEGIIKPLYEMFNLIAEGKVSERHRHRYEVNPKYIDILEENGLIISGKSCERNLVEFIELSHSLHPYFVATQAHPELKSKLEKPSPLFYGIVKSAINRKDKLRGRAEIFRRL